MVEVCEDLGMKKKIMALAVVAATAVTPAYAEPAQDNTSSADSFFYEEDGATLTAGGAAVIAVASTIGVLGLIAAGGAWAISQGLLPNPLAPAVLPAPDPAPVARPMYNDQCSEQEILQPTVGADGSNLVCVFGGRDFRWVYGPAPLGVGTAHEGGYCTVDGGQDNQGKIMLCFNNQWIYGP